MHLQAASALDCSLSCSALVNNSWFLLAPLLPCPSCYLASAFRESASWIHVRQVRVTHASPPSFPPSDSDARCSKRGPQVKARGKEDESGGLSDDEKGRDADALLLMRGKMTGETLTLSLSLSCVQRVIASAKECAVSVRKDTRACLQEEEQSGCRHHLLCSCSCSFTFPFTQEHQRANLLRSERERDGSRRQAGKRPSHSAVLVTLYVCICVTSAFL